MKPFLFSLKFPKIWVGYVSFKWYFEKGGSVGRWETNQFIGMAIQEMKADQKYSKVVGIKGGGGGYINETEGAIKGDYINEINEFQVQLSPRSKKSSIVGVCILIAMYFFRIHLLIYF